MIGIILGTRPEITTTIGDNHSRKSSVRGRKLDNSYGDGTEQN